jgi:hypothetical protein
MSHFTLTIDLTDHEHPGANWQAQHHTVVTLLDRVKQSVGSSPGRRGDIVYTGIANGQSHSTTIGSWEFSSDDPPRRNVPSVVNGGKIDGAPAGPELSLGDPAI